MAISKTAMDAKFITAILGTGAAAGLGGYMLGVRRGEQAVLRDYDNNIIMRRARLGLRTPGSGVGLARGPRDGSGVGRYGYCKDC